MSSVLASLPLGTLAVSGPDALSWLNGLVTQDVAGMAVGELRASLFLTKQGKIRATLWVARADDELLLGVLGHDTAELLAELDHYLVMEDVELRTVPGAWWVGSLDQVTRAALASDGVSRLFDFPWLDPPSLDPSFLGAKGVAIVRLDGRGDGMPELAEESAFEALRVERGFPLHGVDYGDGDNPHEASLDKSLISFSKGCYLGQEVVCMQEMRGKVKRRVVRLEAPDPAVLLPVGASIVSDTGEELGRVTSSAGARALGRVKAPFDVPGAKVVIASKVCEVRGLNPGAAWA